MVIYVFIFETGGDSIQTHSGHMTVQKHNNLSQHNNNNSNNNNSESLRQLSIQTPNQYNFTIDQKDGCTALAPNMVGNHVNGDVNMSLNVVSAWSLKYCNEVHFAELLI